MLEAAAGDERGEIRVAVAAGVAHAGAEEHNRVVEQRLPLGRLLRLELFEKPGKAVDVGRFDRHEVADHDGIVAMVRQAVVARHELPAVEREDLPEPMEEHRDHAGLAAFQGERRQVIEDSFCLDLQVRRDRIVVGQFVRGRGGGLAKGGTLPLHPPLDRADRFEVFVELGPVAGREHPLEPVRIVEHHVERAFAAREQVFGAGAVGLRREEPSVEHARPVDLWQADALPRETHRPGAFTRAGGEFD